MAVDLTEETFNVSSGVSIIDFSADWCGPCKVLAPIFEYVSSKYPKIKTGKVDVSAELKIAQQYRISSVPCLVVFKDGKELERVVGFKGKDSVEQLFQKYTDA